MNFQDTIREQTREFADAIVTVDGKREEAAARVAAADERIQQAASDITPRQALEEERKRLVNQAEESLRDIQENLDEIERQRQDLLQRQAEKLEEKSQAENLLKESGADTEKASDILRAETESRDKAIELLNEIEAEKDRCEDQLKHAHRRSVELYLRELETRIEQAFAGEGERNRQRKKAEEFKKARDEDKNIGDLCDQREQFQELIRLAKVSAVSDTLRRELARVERELEKKYPGALSIEEDAPLTTQGEEIYYLTRADGQVRIVLPITEPVWNKIRDGDTGTEATSAMRVVWEMIKGLSLKSSDGEFRFEDGLCVFAATNLGAQDMPGINEFALTVKDSATVTFKLSPFPAQVQEALNHEATHG